MLTNRPIRPKSDLSVRKLRTFGGFIGRFGRNRSCLGDIIGRFRTFFGYPGDLVGSPGAFVGCLGRKVNGLAGSVGSLRDRRSSPGALPVCRGESSRRLWMLPGRYRGMFDKWKNNRNKLGYIEVVLPLCCQ